MIRLHAGHWYSLVNLMQDYIRSSFSSNHTYLRGFWNFLSSVLIVPIILDLHGWVFKVVTSFAVLTQFISIKLNNPYHWIYANYIRIKSKYLVLYSWIRYANMDKLLMIEYTASPFSPWSSSSLYQHYRY